MTRAAKLASAYQRETKVALWLTDSRNRLATGKIEIRKFADDEAAKAWQVVLAAEFETQEERDDYRQYVESGETESDAADMFNDFWPEMGWSLICIDDDATMRPDFIEVPADFPAPRHTKTRRLTAAVVSWWVRITGCP